MQKSPTLCASTLPDHGPIDLSQLAIPRVEQYVRDIGTPITFYREGITHGQMPYHDIKVGHHMTEVVAMQTQD